MVNSAFWVFAPTLLARYALNSEIDERISNMWRTHRNRVDRGLGGSWKSSGFHADMTQDTNILLPNNSSSLFEIVTGAKMDMFFNSPHLRWHKSFEDYDSHLSDIDDPALDRTTEYERLKVFAPLKKHVVGTTPIIPRHDDDEKFVWQDIQGESIYSHPPDPQNITVDHGNDEEFIWAFPKTAYNQNTVKNQYLTPGGRAGLYSHAPIWGRKLAMPHFYKKEKLEKFYRHWNHRLGLESLKIKHAQQFGSLPNEKQREIMRLETIAYIESCYEFEEL